MTAHERAYLYTDARGEVRWRRFGANNELIGAATEGYNNRKDAIDNAVENGVPIETLKDLTDEVDPFAR